MYFIRYDLPLAPRNRPSLDGSLARIDHPFSPRPSASRIFRIAHTPRFGAGATPLSIPSLCLSLPPSPSCVSDTTWHPLSPLPPRDTSSQLRRPNLCTLFSVLAASYAFEMHELFLRRAKLMVISWRTLRNLPLANWLSSISEVAALFCVDGWHWGKGLFDSWEVGKFVDTTSGINCGPVIIARCYFRPRRCSN